MATTTTLRRPAAARPRPDGLAHRVKELERQIEALETEAEVLEDSIATQESFILDGYIVNVRAARGGGYLAYCGTLRAATQQPTSDAALKDLREAMAVAVEGLKSVGSAVPPKDTDARWLD